MSRRVEPRVISESLKRQAQRLGTLLRGSVLEWIAFENLQKVDVSWFVLWKAVRISRCFVLVNLSHQRVQNVLRKRICLARLCELHQISHHKTYLNLIWRLAVFQTVVVPHVNRSCLVHIEPEVPTFEHIHERSK